MVLVNLAPIHPESILSQADVSLILFQVSLGDVLVFRKKENSELRSRLPMADSANTARLLLDVSALRFCQDEEHDTMKFDGGVVFGQQNVSIFPSEFIHPSRHLLTKCSESDKSRSKRHPNRNTTAPCTSCTLLYV